ncbi:hypothetical protein A3F02_03785 [Candidatus Curtissbacteria bacterium RIFCSPHIGHO2_12_FULL_38_9b]|uniref:Uncharacterized protein n=1 Tax=Candidatus Curtissbacteria bacterium RIFCSPHIGHO2_12_FULL_38_9b TaxID=1797720 RepID=A0A1F5GSR8_9BACT|nr:MAG: hypothetical protein A3F02_03785 [Candidatus Curtissbacteria bacterium RIFCSPHIGHO2_12_FULL_38_9b]
MEDPHLIVEAYKEIMENNLSVRGAEELARKLKARENIVPKQQKPEHRLQSDELEKFQEELSNKLTTADANVKVKISQSRVEGKMHIVAKGNVPSTLVVLKRIRDAVINT